jgi:integrase
VRAFGVRVQPTGAKSFILFRRFPGLNPYQPPQHPVRRTIAHYPDMSLSDARELARDWIAMIKKGIDPSVAAEKEAAANIEAARKAKANTVEAVLKSYLLAKHELRSIHKMETDMRREMAPWLDRSIQDISPQDVKDLINAIKKDGKPGKALATCSLLRGFFSWAVRADDYGLQASPFAKINMRDLVGKAKEGNRTLGKHEIRAYWKAAETLPYPTGPYFQLLLLTALRRGEANASWSEIDLDAKRWIIPAARMKARLTHLVPITPRIAKLLDTLPRSGGPFLFSTTGGSKPIAAFIMTLISVGPTSSGNASGVMAMPWISDSASCLSSGVWMIRPYLAWNISKATKRAKSPPAMRK